MNEISDMQIDNLLCLSDDISKSSGEVIITKTDISLTGKYRMNMTNFDVQVNSEQFKLFVEALEEMNDKSYNDIKTKFIKVILDEQKTMQDMQIKTIKFTPRFEITECTCENLPEKTEKIDNFAELVQKDPIYNISTDPQELDKYYDNINSLLHPVHEFVLDDFPSIMRALYTFMMYFFRYTARSFQPDDILFCQKSTKFEEWLKKTKQEYNQNSLYFIIMPESLSDDQKRRYDEFVKLKTSSKHIYYFILTTKGNNLGSLTKEDFKISIEEKIRNNLKYHELKDKVHLVFTLIPGTDQLQILYGQNYKVYDIYSNSPFPLLDSSVDVHYIRFDPGFMLWESPFFFELFKLVFLNYTENQVPNKIGPHQKIYLEFPAVGVMENINDFPFPINEENVHIIRPDCKLDRYKFPDPRINGLIHEVPQKFKGQIWDIKVENYVPELNNLLNFISLQIDFPDKLKNMENVLSKMEYMFEYFFNDITYALSICELISINKYIKRYSPLIKNYYERHKKAKSENESKKQAKPDNLIPKEKLYLIFLESAIITSTRISIEKNLFNFIYLFPKDIFNTHNSLIKENDFQIIIFKNKGNNELCTKLKLCDKNYESLTVYNYENGSWYEIKKDPQIKPKKVEENNTKNILIKFFQASAKYDNPSAKEVPDSELNFFRYKISVLLLIRAAIIYCRICAGIPYCLCGETGSGKTSIIELLQGILKQFNNEMFIIKTLNCNAETYTKEINKFIREDMIDDTSISEFMPIDGRSHINYFFDEANTSPDCPNIFYLIHKIGLENYDPDYGISAGCAINRLTKIDEISKEMGRSGMKQKIPKREQNKILKNVYYGENIHDLSDLKYFVNEQTYLIQYYEINCDPIRIDEENEFMTNEEKQIIINLNSHYYDKLKERQKDPDFKKLPKEDEEKRKKDSSECLITAIQFLRVYSNDRAVASYREIDFFWKIFEDVYNNDIGAGPEKFYNAMFVSLFVKFIARLPKVIKLPEDIRGKHQLFKANNPQENIKPREIFAKKLAEKVKSENNIQYDIIEIFRSTSYRVSWKYMNDRSIMKSDALAEHIYQMIICGRTELSGFMIGIPGTSKSYSYKVLTKTMKRIKYSIYMSSRSCTSNGLKLCFENLARHKLLHYKEKNIYFAFLEEIGILLHSYSNPTKILHEALEKGILIGNKRVKISIIGFSNYALDFSNMNRCIYFFTDSFTNEDWAAALYETQQTNIYNETQQEKFYNDFQGYKQIKEFNNDLFNYILTCVSDNNDISNRDIFELIKIQDLIAKKEINNNNNKTEKEIEDLESRLEALQENLNNSQQVKPNTVDIFKKYVDSTLNMEITKPLIIISENYAFILMHCGLFSNKVRITNFASTGVGKEQDVTALQILKTLNSNILSFAKFNDIMNIFGPVPGFDSLLDIMNYTDGFDYISSGEAAKMVYNHDLFTIILNASRRPKIVAYLKNKDELDKFPGPVKQRCNILEYTPKSNELKELKFESFDECKKKNLELNQFEDQKWPKYHPMVIFTKSLYQRIVEAVDNQDSENHKQFEDFTIVKQDHKQFKIGEYPETDYSKYKNVIFLINDIDLENLILLIVNVEYQIRTNAMAAFKELEDIYYYFVICQDKLMGSFPKTERYPVGFIDSLVSGNEIQEIIKNKVNCTDDTQINSIAHAIEAYMNNHPVSISSDMSKSDQKYFSVINIIDKSEFWNTLFKILPKIDNQKIQTHCNNLEKIFENDQEAKRIIIKSVDAAINPDIDVMDIICQGLESALNLGILFTNDAIEPIKQLLKDPKNLDEYKLPQFLPGLPLIKDEFNQSPVIKSDQRPMAILLTQINYFKYLLCSSENKEYLRRFFIVMFAASPKAAQDGAYPSLSDVVKKYLNVEFSDEQFPNYYAQHSIYDILKAGLKDFIDEHNKVANSNDKISASHFVINYHSNKKIRNLNECMHARGKNPYLFLSESEIKESIPKLENTKANNQWNIKFRKGIIHHVFKDDTTETDDKGKWAVNAEELPPIQKLIPNDISYNDFYDIKYEITIENGKINFKLC